LDPWWNPAAEAQAVDRAHRIGQKNKVFTYKFISKDTLEEKILQLQEAKKKLANELITIEDNFVKSLSKSDIQKLFD
jgi:SNF2 family DNA or RNA helicase